MRLLVVGPERALSPAVDEMIALRGVEVISVEAIQEARDPKYLTAVDAVLLPDLLSSETDQSVWRELYLLAETLAAHHLMGIVLSPGTSGVVPGGDDTLMTVSPEVSADELWGSLAAVRHLRPHLRRMDEKVRAMQRLGKKVNENLMEVDQELRLASRLQRDFLPRTFPEVGDIRFAALFRPATWVSGDIYDVRRLAEHRAGFFLADAMGHGVAAGLLTMFIKEAIVGKPIQEDAGQMASPGEILANLNNELAAQDLPNCQFTTACCGCVDARTHELVFARGGHPHPIHVDRQGRCCEVETQGGLLGVFPGGDFPDKSIILEPGDKLFIYSDGLEEAVVPGRDESGKASFTPMLMEAVRLPALECLDTLARHLDAREGSLQPSDDQACLVIERLAD